MKQTFVVLILALFQLGAAAQTGAKPKPKAPAKPGTPATTAAIALKTLDDSSSYAMGYSLASFYKQQGISKINTTIVSRAINDVMTGKKTLLDDVSANTTMNRCISLLMEDKSKPNIDSGAAFLIDNKKKAGVKTTASGLQYEVIKEGTGAKPLATDSVTVNYKGTLVNGTEFDNSYTRGEPITFPLNRVIPGWTEGVQLMSVGSKYKFYIPHTLGYGPSDNGPIPGGSTLIFEVELLDVKKGAQQ